MRSVWLVVALAACGGKAKQGTVELGSFQCRDRTASYSATHHMGGDELGVQLDCATASPRIQRWKMSKQGQRVADTRKLTPGQFDEIWSQIDGAGWANMHDCTNGTGGKQDPIYVFEIKDDQNTAKFECQSRTMPYPYNTIVDPLDAAAQADSKQLGGDEPDVDHKKPKK